MIESPPVTEEWVRSFVLRLVGGRLAQAFPVGAVYVNVTGVNPATELGYGTWTAIGAGRALVGFASGDPEFGTLEGTPGATTVTPTGSTQTVSDHTHTYTEVPNHVHPLTLGDPSHAHTVPILSSGIGTAGTVGVQGVSETNGTKLSSEVAPATPSSPTSNPTGGVATGTTAQAGGHSHGAGTLAVKVVQPSLVVCFWKRTA